MGITTKTGPPNNLRELREKAKLAQEALARRADISANTIVRLEGKDRPTPTLATAHKIASALGVKVDEIWPPQEAAS